jgi:aminobenzoyl-glutamate utilization protein A
MNEFLKELEPKLKEWRRNFHKYPELGFMEYMTTYQLNKELQGLGFQTFIGEEAMVREARLGIPDEEALKLKEKEVLEAGIEPDFLEKLRGGMTGVVAVLDTKKPGPHTAFRFDIDALPIFEAEEETHLPCNSGFRSQVDGVMHACGHDGHATIGLGVASFLSKYQNQLNGKFTILFQPAEEGGRGARAMVEKGWLDDVDYFYSGHIGINDLPVGTVAATVKGFLDSSKFNVTFKGNSSHAGMHPELGKNALLAATTAASNLYAIPRHADGITRVNVGRLVAGSGRNIIPEDAYMEVETRGETKEIGTYMKEEALRMVKAAAALHDVECEIEYVGVTEQFSCDEEIPSLVQQACKNGTYVKEILPEATVSGSEDCSFMINRVQEKGGKATYMLFGTKLDYPHHHPAFDFEEEVLPAAVETIASVVNEVHGHE